MEESLPQVRLDTYLRTQFPAASRGILQRLIVQGHIKVNGQPAKPDQRPRAGDRVDVYWPEARPAESPPQDIPLNIVYEDADLLVLNKAPGMVVHPSVGHDEHTLVNALLHHCRGQLSGIGGVARPGIVHRLDKETSGCMVVAKNDQAHLALADQFKGRSMSKVYDAIVCGNLMRDSGEIRAAIARHYTHRKQMTVQEGGREAWTSYKVIERLRGATWVEARIHTGRTHQIRVHFQSLGHPLAGDTLYGKRQNTHLRECSGYSPPRVLLHARTLTFAHPRTGKREAFAAPLPEDFVEAVTALRFREKDRA